MTSNYLCPCFGSMSEQACQDSAFQHAFRIQYAIRDLSEAFCPHPLFIFFSDETAHKSTAAAVTDIVVFNKHISHSLHK